MAIALVVGLGFLVRMLVVMAVVMTMLGVGLNLWAEQQAHSRQREQAQQQALMGWHRVSVQLMSTYGHLGRKGV